jgi:hypothetical protein
MQSYDFFRQSLAVFFNAAPKLLFFRRLDFICTFALTEAVTGL